MDQFNNNFIKQINVNGKFICSTISSSLIQILQLFKVDKNESWSKIEDICEVNFNSFKYYNI